jgi:hypothetical protein
LAASGGQVAWKPNLTPFLLFFPSLSFSDPFPSLGTQGVVVSRSPEQQALHLLQLLDPRAEVVRRYVSDPNYLVRVLFWWESVTETAGFDLSSGTVARLAAGIPGIRGTAAPVDHPLTLRHFAPFHMTAPTMAKKTG